MKWEKFTLSDIISIKHGYAFKGEYFSDEPTDDVLLTPGNFNIGGGFKSQKLKFYKGEVPDDYILKVNDIIVTMTDLSINADTLGYSAKIPDWSNKRLLHNQRLGLVLLQNNNFDLNYIYWLLRTYNYQRYVANGATGATVKHSSPTKILSYTFDAPFNLTTQKRIASILSAYDDLIENNLKRIKLLEEAARCEYRLLMMSEILSEVKLGEVAVINEESLKTVSELDNILYIDISSVTEGSINFKTEYDRNSAPGRAKRIVKNQDIIWSCVRPNRRSYAMIWEPETNLIVSTGFAVITSKKIPSLFLYQSLSTDEFVKYLENNATGSAYPAVTSKDFEKAKICITSFDTMQEYQNRVIKFYDLIYNLAKQNSKLREARDILLPRLMSGEINV